jgi:iron-sulfur cluster repair protein YtfE (RIC family)
MATKKKSASKSAKKHRRDPNAATALLVRQHRKVEATFKKIETGKGDRTALVSELASDLAAHMHIEQEIFYPAVRRLDNDTILESFEEHAGAETALQRLLSVDPDDETFDAKVSVLKELIEHHVEEEESSLFPTVDRKLTADENRSLGEHMREVFGEVVKRGYEAALPQRPESKTSADVAEQRVLSQGNGDWHGRVGM